MQTGELVSTTLNLRVGDRVEVRNPEEILATLDENGTLDAMPFMPEMLHYSGRQFTVGKVAHKTCDTISGTGIRRMDNAVHLTGVRCNGRDHDGCQAACLIYWKTAWLKKVKPVVGQDGVIEDTGPSDRGLEAPGADRLLPLLVIGSRREPAEDGARVYTCQATELVRATPYRLPYRQVSQYVQDVRSGNVGVWWVLRALLVGVFNRAQDHSTRRLPPRLWFRGGQRWGFLKGTATKTPARQTGLQPGDLVRIRSKDEIVATLDANLKNRGMGFDAEMARFCGRTARVLRRVDHIVDERTGRMLVMKNPCIVLDGVVCEGAYNASCPRAITSYWREIWLEKIEEPG